MLPYAQEPEPKDMPAANAAAAPGFRAEVLGGFDERRLTRTACSTAAASATISRSAAEFLLGVDGEYSDVDHRPGVQFPGLPGLTAEDGPELYVGGRATFVLSSRIRLHGGGRLHADEGKAISSRAIPIRRPSAR